MAAVFFLFRLSIFFLSSTFTSTASSSSSSSPPSYPDGRAGPEFLDARGAEGQTAAGREILGKGEWGYGNSPGRVIWFWALDSCPCGTGPGPGLVTGRSYRIDCGSLSVSIDSFNTTRLSEGLFTGGAISPVSEPLRFRQTHEKTLCYFPLSSSEKTATPSPICPPADTSSAHSPCTTTTMANPTPPPSTSPSWALSSFPEAPLCPMTSPEPAHTRIYSLSSPTPTPMSASTALPMTLP
ncbi:hypothetical protein DVH24_007370 [Malus domestica]|uniref:Uncharacterized protein n=1 Tax=Malus domestica TaxID=3750 RepID=A0A498HIF9_MALDO|nr:hypothetical protein DVH24_007370 [Malus domestica]